MIPKNAEQVAPSQNIFLVGLMGAGKTSVGKLLSKDLRMTFVDCDQEIEKRTGVPVSVIFDIEGEEGFRRRETNILRELVQLQDVVLATGGGAVIQAENREMLCKGGLVVYLRATVDELWQRTRHDRNRPLLRTGDARAKLAELFVQRDPLYREVADITVETGSQSLRTLVSELEQRLRRAVPREPA
jgi:shikimate kinase